MKYAFIQNNIAVEVVQSSPSMLFVPQYAAQFVEVPDSVLQGWRIVDGEWLEPLPLPVYVPQKVTQRQGRAILIIDGKIDLVQPAIDSISDPVQRALAQNEWDCSQAYERQRPLLIGLASAIGYDTDEKLDDLFIRADKL